MIYTPILGSLGYVLSPCQKQVLMVHRNARKEDHHLGKYNGLGGKMERNEDAAACMIREIHEEAGIEVEEMQLRGTVNWTGFGPNGEDWLGFIFLIEKFKGTPFDKNPEGDLVWVEINKIKELPMWEGDRYFLPLLFDNDTRPFHGFMPYENGEPLGWTYHRL